MHKEPLSLHHRELLFSRLKDLALSCSEYSFSNCYLFRTAHHYKLVYENNDLFLQGKTYDGVPYLMPTKNIENYDEPYLHDLLQRTHSDAYFPVPATWLSAFSPDRWHSEYQEEDSDYIYTTEKIKTYAGKKLHKKRNLLKQFLDNYTYEGRPLTAAHIPAALMVLEEWYHSAETKKNATDYQACKEALERADELMLCGGIYFVNGKPAGFVLGEEIRNDMYALHFAKAIILYKGIYQFMFNTFAHILPEQYRFLNFEQDLGITALRQSKESYYPDEKVKKYRVFSQ